MTRTPAALALLVGLAGAGLLTACRTMGVNGAGNKNTGKHDIDVYLYVKDAICQVKEPVEDMGGRNGAKVSWMIHNACPDIEYVTFGNYHERLSDGTISPNPDPKVVDPDPALSGPVAKLTGTEKVKGKITKEVKDSDLRFKYSICVAKFGEKAKCLDPDVDIWP
jgi:hypothetical protein